jgi:hypothetical protein
MGMLCVGVPRLADPLGGLDNCQAVQGRLSWLVHARDRRPGTARGPPISAPAEANTSTFDG